MTQEENTLKSGARSSALKEAINRLSVSLYRHLAKANKDVVVSPYFVSAAVAMVYLGARSKTATQIEEAMNWSALCDHLTETFSHSLDSLTQKETKDSLKAATRMFIANGFTILNEYLEMTERHLKAATEHVDFEGGCEKGRKRINAWLEDETSGAVKEMLPPGSVGDFTKLLLVNCVCFSGRWNYPFNKSDTQTDTFKTLEGEKVQVSMMNMCKLFPYVALTDLKCRLVELPYVNRHLSMFLFLPVQASCLRDLEAGLLMGEQTLQHLLDAVKPTLVHVSLPKFRMTSQYDMRDVLASVGMTYAFKDAADLSGITGNAGLHISQFVHHTVLGVDEEGNEENDGSVRNCGPSPFRSKLVYFIVNHPFIFVVRDNRTGVILFIGKVLKPVQS
ncbi:leukocyte elastase inhibitor-like [Gigantopelta aegis]|uniref:leukocyte elastase inhibitor-like n=1 Tax=Gigantopelta aegis TaxID=1735272 RepID=UPI001B88C0D3|nr:leukocyte elastase inhibitor-like [Gigantopelta aegis]